MSLVTLYPDGESGHTYHWTVNTGTHHDALREADGDTSYVATSANGRYLDLTFDNPTYVPCTSPMLFVVL